MSVTKYGTNNRWMSQIRVTDWKGNTIHKEKRLPHEEGSPAMGTRDDEPSVRQSRHDVS